MSPDDVTIPGRLAEWVAYLAVGVFTFLTALLGWLGKRQVRRWERRLNDLEGHLDDLEGQMGDDHDGVESGVGELREEIRALRQDIRRE
jgi:membrane protein implicated in regulation of membrane protease activity